MFLRYVILSVGKTIESACMNDDNFLERLKIFGENVRKYREKANITIKELSEKTDIRKQYLKRIEKGNCIGISTSQVYLLAEGLNITPRELCEGM